MTNCPDTTADLETTATTDATAEATAARPALRVDVEAYQAYLEDTDLSDAQKREVIEALWSIVVAFVELGFGVHPVQEARITCGQSGETEQKPRRDKQNMIECNNKSLSSNCNIVVGSESGAAAEGVET